MPELSQGVFLDPEKCVGCTNCMKRCPTEAIRVQQGKALIHCKRCIKCGECTRACPHHAATTVCDKLSAIDRFKYKIAVPSPPLYGQFRQIEDVDLILTALKQIGFDEIFEEAASSELVGEATEKFLREHKGKGPFISSSCPSILRLVQLKFPGLCDRITPFVVPAEAAAVAAREGAEQRGIPKEDIGVFYISPCPAKTAQLTSSENKIVDGVLSVSDVYPRMAHEMGRIDKPTQLSASGSIGVRWSYIGGEAGSAGTYRHVAVDGMENVINVLERMEDGKLDEIDYLELSACPGGCVGGVLNVADPYLARARIRAIRRSMPRQKNFLRCGEVPPYLVRAEKLEPISVMRLSRDLNKAMDMLGAIDSMLECLPGIDCAACGSPTCRSFAEDVVKGKKELTDCTFYEPQRS